MSALRLSTRSVARRSWLWLPVLLTPLLAVPIEPLYSQEGQLSETRVLEAAREVMKTARYCFLATLAYYDATTMGYVTLVGTARMVDDLEARREYWKPEWAEFYPNGPTADDYILIEFAPSRIEVMSFAHDVMGSGVFGPAVLKRKASGWSLEEQ